MPDVHAICIRLARMLRRRPLSVMLAISGWTALGALTVLSDAVSVCVSGDVCLNSSSYWTVSLLLGALLLMANEAAPDLTMLGFTVLLVLSDVISDAEAWAGFSSTSVLAIGALFVVARAIEETRAVEKILMPVLGRPRGHRSALLRLCIPVALFSAFMNNTPIVAMLLSVSEGWAARSNLSIKVLLMPLSFASMLGGMCTLIGTSTNLVLNAQIEADPEAPLPPLKMFSMTTVGLPAAFVGILYIAVVAPLVFQPRGAATTIETKADCVAMGHGIANQTVAKRNEALTPTGARRESAKPGFGSRGSPRYLIEVELEEDCQLLIGKPASQFGALVIDCCPSSCIPQQLLRADVVHPLCNEGEGGGGGGGSDDECTDKAHMYALDAMRMQPGDRLIVACLAEGIEALRFVAGLRLRPDAPAVHLAPLGCVPPCLVLVEAAVASDSPLANMALPEALQSRELSGADVWAIRQRADALSPPLSFASNRSAVASTASGLSTAPTRATPGVVLFNSVRCDALPATAVSIEGSVTLTTGAKTTLAHGPRLVRELSQHDAASTTIASIGTVDSSADEPVASDRRGEASTSSSRILQAGDTLLLLAPESWLQAHRVTRSFALLSRVVPVDYGRNHKSDSTHADELTKHFKLGASLVALLALMLLSAFEVVGIFPLALTLGYALVFMECITLEQAWRSIGYRLVLTIACSFGPGRALTNTNVSAIIGAALLELQPLGPFGFLLCIYVVTSVFSCVVSNSATVVAFYSVLRQIEVPGLTGQQIMIAMMLGASSAFATPIGYQTNLMVIGRGGYTFQDFLVLGGGLTIVVGCCVAGSCLLLQEDSQFNASMI